MTKGEIIAIVVLSTLFISLFTWLAIDIVKCNKECRITGTVVEKFRTNAAYKRSAEAHVVIFSDSLRRNIDIEVTWNCYANMYTGKKVVFNLREGHLNQ